jgi:Transcription factor S-II (TFIIS), central domain
MGSLFNPCKEGEGFEKIFGYKLKCSGRGAGLGKDYRLQARSLAFNLKDPANPDLRARVLHGELSAHSLVRLSNADLASKVRSPPRPSLILGPFFS